MSPADSAARRGFLGGQQHFGRRMLSMDADAIKRELPATIRAEWANWEALLAQVGVERMSEPGVEGDQLVKDLVAHVATYEDWMAQLLNAGGPDIPHVTDGMHQDARNAWIFDQHRHNRDGSSVICGYAPG
jgi:hypothetical protein